MGECQLWESKIVAVPAIYHGEHLAEELEELGMSAAERAGALSALREALKYAGTEQAGSYRLVGWNHTEKRACRHQPQFKDNLGSCI